MSAIMAAVPEQTYVEKPAPEGLERLVSTLWMQRVSADSAPYSQRNIPNGHAEIHYRVGDTSQIVGQRTTPTVDTLAPGTALAGARIRPAATRAVFGLPAQNLLNRTFEVEEFSLGDFRCRLASTCSPEHALELLEGDLLARAAVAPAVDRVAEAAVRRLERGGHGGLKAIRSDLSLSERHFRRRVREATGLTPKTLDRMLRFQRLLASTQLLIDSGDDPTTEATAALAAAAGYADESHLNRECRRLTGQSAGQFLAQNNDTCGCGHDHAASFNRILGVGAATTEISQ